MHLRRKYAWNFRFTIKKFMTWEAGELTKVELGVRRKKVGRKAWPVQYTEKWIPVPYARLVQQFTYEDKHGREDGGHEAVRRMNYAQRMLEAFGKELEGYKGAQEDFRSKVLNPVLQRQLRGLPDSYAPPLIDYMSGKAYSKVTLANATAFYLSVDPLDPGCIPSYRRNLVYIREARWHLLVLKKEIKVGSAQKFNWSIGNHELILDALENDDEIEEGPEDDADPVPRLGFTEVLTILYEGLTTYFAKELLRVVRIGLSPEFLRTHRY